MTAPLDPDTGDIITMSLPDGTTFTVHDDGADTEPEGETT